MALTKIQSLGITDGTIVNADINASAAIAGTKLSGAGKVLQVVSTTKTDSFNSSSTSLVDITGLSVSITPSSASNKILVFGSIASNTVNGAIIHFQLVRGSTEIAKGTNAYTYVGTIGTYMEGSSTNYNIANNSFHFYDSPSSTSSTTYKIQTKNNTGGTTYINNRGTNDSSFISTITVVEIAG